MNDLLRYIESDDTWNSLNPSPLFFFFLFERRINVPNMWQRQLYFPTFSLPYSLHPYPSLPLPPSGGSGSILLFRSLSAVEKVWQMWQIWSYVEITLTRQRFSTRSIPDPVALAEPKIGLLFFPPLLFFFLLATAGFQSAERPSAKKHFISDPIISSA